MDETPMDETRRDAGDVSSEAEAGREAEGSERTVQEHPEEKAREADGDTEPVGVASQDIPAPEATGESESAPTRESFAELLAEAGMEDQPRWKRGDKVKARVVRVSDEWVFVSLGGKEEGSVRAEEFRASAEGEEGAKPPSEGEEVEAYVLSTSGGEVVLTTKLGKRDASAAAIEAAWANGIPVEGRVAKTIKGGFEVRVSGLRAFCPLSQIDLRWPKTPEEHVGQAYSFKITEFKEKGRNIIISRRALLEEERTKKRETLKDTVEPGAVVSGTVRSIQNFGAFVDLGGVDALIPISEMSWGRIEDPTHLLSEGQKVTAQVLSVDWERDRVSLSLKALEEDPWEVAARNYRPGERVTGTVVRLAPFGAFVNLQPGVDGLVHISALGAGRRVNHPKEVLQTGESVEVEVLSVDPEKRRISLSLEHRYLESLGDLPTPGQVLQGTVESVAGFGVFVRLPSGHTGLVPNAEMGTPRGTDHARSFKPGDGVEVQVLDVEEGGRRIRLSRKAVGEEREAADVKNYAASAATQEGGSTFGTLGDLLKAKLENKE